MDIRMGKPGPSGSGHDESIVMTGKPSELKHLSSWRKGHQQRLRQ
uniref:Uncharacterized protein n=1 Tax=uncultured Rhodospirillales bacterium HF4000_24M03 TaxID=710788 RepID=E0XW24_9PROT|nr:hypothetical protein [uncultured Rhodospirillales bacterium HF4000_24M03]